MHIRIPRGRLWRLEHHMERLNEQQRLVWITDGSVDKKKKRAAQAQQAPAEESKVPQEESKADRAKEDKASKWRVKKSETGFVPDENKQVR